MPRLRRRSRSSESRKPAPGIVGASPRLFDRARPFACRPQDHILLALGAQLSGEGYNKSQVTIPVAIELPKIRAGQKCNSTLKLDDVEEYACRDEVDNESTGEFTVSDKGTQSYKPEDNWRYTIRWHLK